jgi:hypothetical protein
MSTNSPNMSYCMFENTVRALNQCRKQLREEGLNQTQEGAGLDERPYVLHLIELCEQIVEDYVEGEYGEDAMGL